MAVLRERHFERWVAEMAVAGMGPDDEAAAEETEDGKETWKEGDPEEEDPEGVLPDCKDSRVPVAVAAACRA